MVSSAQMRDATLRLVCETHARLFRWPNSTLMHAKERLINVEGIREQSADTIDEHSATAIAQAVGKEAAIA